MIILQACLKDLTYIQKDNWKAYSITGHVGKLKTAKKYKKLNWNLMKWIGRIDTLDTLSFKYKSLGKICE